MAIVHRFGPALNEHTRFHVCVIDDVCDPHGNGVHFQPAPALSPSTIETVQAAMRRRILHAFQRRGWLERGRRIELDQ